MRSRSSACLLLASLTVSSTALYAQSPAMTAPNYTLAARWTPQKISRLVFDTSVSPHWLESGDKFWYTFETRRGRQYWLVDCRAKTKKPLFDNAKMAAMLTRITLIPYDAQHLPIRNLKFVKDDTVLQFEIELRKEGAIRVGEEVKTVGEVGESDAAKRGETQQEKDKQKEDQVNKQVEDQKKVDQQKQQDQKQEQKQDDKQKQDEQKKQDTKQETKQVTVQTGRTQQGRTPPTPESLSPTKTLYFEYDPKTEKVVLLPDFKAPAKKMLWASVSPDEKTIIFARGHNLFMMDAANYALAQKKADDKAIKEVQLTTDGEDHYSYARTLREDNKRVFQRQERDRKDYRVPAIGVTWSKDSSKFAVERTDERKVADLWVINSVSRPRPTLETYRYEMPGEENQPQPEILVFDVASRAKVKVKADRFKDQSVDIQTDRVLSREREQDKVVSKWLSDTPDKLYFMRSSRDRHRVDVCVADTATGEVKTLIEERLNTYIDTKPLRLANSGKELLFWSERDGWGHFYRYDTNGKLRNQVTSGEFNCSGIAGIDDKDGMAYVTAMGRESGEDPYYVHLYKVRLDGQGDVTLVNPGNANHSVSMSDDARWFVDTSSQVGTVPHTELRNAKGEMLATLEETDVSALVESGYKFPESFQVKADDGVTDLYGVIYKPFDFDPKRRYPIIEYVYPGPQTEAVTKSFSPRSSNIALAQLGFIVIEVGNRGGSPQRSKWYHNYGYGNLRDYGLADKKRAIEQLALRYPWIDADRVGIYGHSGGGFMSAAAMLVYPDFFKVGYSESGNHENNIYNRWWSESHHGVTEKTDKDGKVTFSYDISKNSDLAKNLKGHLMLVTGDIDDNVHPANTYRLVDALIRANKRFDFFLFPGQRHGYTDMGDYNFWLRADYFCRHLLGESPMGADRLELQREQALTGGQSSRGGGQSNSSDDSP